MSAAAIDKARAFVQLHERAGVFVIPNPWDIGTARILAGLGFEALATTSAGLAFSLGRRDGEGAVTRGEAIEHARQIALATPLPVSADLENGFGDAPDDVAETIRQAAAAGLAGASIEDATGDPRRPLYDQGQAVERIAAAVEVVRSLPFPFTLTARAENFLYGRADLDDTIRRLHAFEAAGADVLYAPGLRTLDDIRQLCQSLSKPVNVLAGLSGFSLSLADLATAGVRRISLGASLARAALGALLSAGQEIQEHGAFTFANTAAPYRELSRFMASREQRLGS